jgi:YVTN family beta-propeller protein
MAKRIAIGLTIALVTGWICASHQPRDIVAITQAAESPVSESVTTPDVNRSPVAVAVSPDGKFIASANHTGDSVSLVDTKTLQVVAEHRCGNGPADVVWIDDRTLLVSLLNDDAVAFLSLDNNRLRTEKVVAVGDEPRGLAVKPAAKSEGRLQRAYVAVSGLDEVAVLDLKKQTVTARVPVGGMPRTLTVSPNGRWLVTCCSVPGVVYVHDTKSLKQISQRGIFEEAFNLGPPIVLPDSSACIFASQINRVFQLDADNIEKGWAIDNRLTKLPLPDGDHWEQKQMGLDLRGDAAGDAYAPALSPDGRWLVVTCSGSHELLVLDRKKFTWPPAQPGDFVPVEFRETEGGFRRVELGGRPLGVTFLDDRRAVVANYMNNSVQIVDVVAAKVLKSIELGGPKTPSLARRGEAIFYDADRSLDSWFSCGTCHTEGHTCGQKFDTLNDGNYDTDKLAPTLRGVTKTSPWTWHGWQTSLDAALRKSLRDTLISQKPTTDDDIRAMLAFLGTLKYPLSPFRRANGELTTAASRGKHLFEGKANCIPCHRGEHFTTKATYKVGLESNRYFFPEFNPPSLRGVHARRIFLHDGRASNLEEVLTRHHQPEKLAGERLTDKELADLIAYLKSI